MTAGEVGLFKVSDNSTVDPRKLKGYKLVEKETEIS
jgi:hypothetical protein